MESRSKKSRSLAIDSKAAPQKRPELGDRHNSAPSANRRRESQSKRVSAGPKTTETSRRSSKASPRDEPQSRPSSHRLSDRPKSSNTLVDRRSSSGTDPDEIITLTFAVLGVAGVGKSTFTNNALEQQKSSGSPLSSSKVSLGGSLYRIQLVEITFDDADFSSSRRVIWPKYLNGVPFPSIHGAFCLYDVTEEDSVAQIPQALAALSNSEVPCVLIACKADVPENLRHVQPRFHEQVRRSFANVAVFETAKDEPASHKRCLLNMLNQHLAASKGSKPGSRGQSASNGCPTTAQRHDSRDTSPEKSRSRSRSHSGLRVSKSKDLLPTIPARPPVIESGDEDSDQTEDGIEIPAPLKTKLRVDTSNVPRSRGRPTGPQTPISSEELTTSQLISPSEPAQSAIPETPESYYVKSMLRPTSVDTADSRAFQTFLNMEEESHDDSPHEVTSAAKDIQKLTVEDGPAKDSGVSFQELVERLLCLPASKQDSKFVPSFLCLYRMFATPKQLLVAIIDQFMKTEKSNIVRFTKVAEMLRYLQVLGEWTARYPGDFAQPPARDIANTFVQSIEKSREFGAAAKELKNNLETYVPDDDLDWAYDDAPTSASSKDTSGTKQKTPDSSSTSIPSSMTDSSLKLTPSRSFQHDSGEGDDGSFNASSILRTGNSSQSYLNVFQLEHAREEAKRLRPDPHLRLSKIQWHQFMEIPVEMLAREITRIDWTTYASIRPRDYVRHVVLSEHKRRSRRGDNISLMVRQFNHLALFVSGMILLRDKPKHRARALEKFMALAWKVRQLNNYNSLGAIVAGINGHEIARLGQTRELVPPEVQKQFMRLTILMGISRSHAAYRMAWENSFAERIPFLPLLRQDLTMAASANQTFIGPNINWQKFKIMGDAIVGVLGSLEHPYSFTNRTSTSDHVVSLILQTKILEESEDSADPRGELYDRSVQVEPQPGVDARKKFEWLRR